MMVGFILSGVFFSLYVEEKERHKIARHLYDLECQNHFLLRTKKGEDL